MTEQRTEIWLEANTAALDSYNAYIEQNRLPLESVRLFSRVMKMENILRAHKAATVKATPVKAGENVAVDQIIVEFE